jgi:hypothetical protein
VHETGYHVGCSLPWHDFSEYRRNQIPPTTGMAIADLSDDGVSSHCDIGSAKTSVLNVEVKLQVSE